MNEDTRLIDRDQVRHIGFLIRLALTEEEVDLFSEQLSSIVGYFNRLAEVDVTDVPPYRHSPLGRAALREDAVRPTLPREDFLVNAPQQAGGFVKVPVVLEVPDEDEG